MFISRQVYKTVEGVMTGSRPVESICRGSKDNKHRHW